MSKDITPENENGEWHGYHEWYFSNGQSSWKGVYVNAKAYGYFKYCYIDGGVVTASSGYFLDGDRLSINNEEGYCYIWNKKVSKKHLTMRESSTIMTV